MGEQTGTGVEFIADRNVEPGARRAMPKPTHSITLKVGKMTGKCKEQGVMMQRRKDVLCVQEIR